MTQHSETSDLTVVIHEMARVDKNNSGDSKKLGTKTVFWK